MNAPVTIPAVHLMATKRKTLCGLSAKPFPEQQSCPAGMWEAVKPEHRCPVCAGMAANLQAMAETAQ